jgi:hypothetical protein
MTTSRLFNMCSEQFCLDRESKILSAFLESGGTWEASRAAHFSRTLLFSGESWTPGRILRHPEVTTCHCLKPRPSWDPQCNCDWVYWVYWVFLKLYRSFAGHFSSPPHFTTLHHDMVLLSVTSSSPWQLTWE